MLDKVWSKNCQSIGCSAGSISIRTIQQPIDYEDAIATLVRQLPAERAAQLYDFARFLLKEAGSIDQSAAIEDEAAEEQLSEEELVAEDTLWEASMARQADRFAALKTQAKADVKAQKTASMYDERGELSVELRPISRETLR